MTLRRFALASRPAIRAGALLSALGAVGLAVASANTEAVVAQRFTAALETVATAADAPSAPRAIVSGSEAYWLAEKLRHDDGAIEPAAWSPPLAAGLSVGDRITISSGKAERILEVVTISEVEPAPAASAAGTPIHQVAVTCRDLSTAEGRLTTFLMPADTPPAPAKPGRTL